MLFATQIVKYFSKSFINGREDSYDIEARSLTGENDLDYIKTSAAPDVTGGMAEGALRRL